MSRPRAPCVGRRSVLIGSLFAALTVTGGCGQSGPLVLPSSAQLPPSQTGTPQTDEGDSESQDEERTENER
jgi:predicted small lipoprotein YifL